MDSNYRALVGLTYPSTPEGYKKALAAKTDADFAAISWARTEVGEKVPDYVIKASPWLVDQGKVEVAAGAPAKAAPVAPAPPAEKSEGKP